MLFVGQLQAPDIFELPFFISAFLSGCLTHDCSASLARIIALWSDLLWPGKNEHVVIIQK